MHTLFYLIDRSDIDRIIGELDRLYIWTGWLAFLIFLPLATTSFNAAVKRLGRWWKPLQRLTYAAAILTLVHWASLHEWRHPEAALLTFAPLAALSAYRRWWVYLRPRVLAMGKGRTRIREGTPSRAHPLLGAGVARAAG